MKALAELLVQASRSDLRIEDATSRLSGAQVLTLSEALVKELQSGGVSASEPVILLIGNRGLDFVGMLAVWRAGMVAVPLQEDAPPDVIVQMRDTVGARFVVRQGRLQDRVEGRPGTTSLPGDAALVIYTSGSTGRPKGVVLSHERLAEKIGVLHQLLQLQPGDQVVVPLQLTFVFGIWLSLLALKAGATLVLMPKFSVSEMEARLRSGASVIGVVPTMLRTMQLDPSAGFENVRLILTGGEALLPAVAEKARGAFPRAEIFDLYGSTETGSCDFYLNVKGASEHGTIGRPTAGVAFRIVGEDGRDCEIGGLGELRIKTPFGMTGYFDDVSATHSAFDGDGYFCTGDLGRVRADGLVELAGRKKEIISRGGIKVSPLEVESVFSRHPDVTSVLCGGVPDDRLGETVHLLVVNREGARVDKQALLTWASARLERQKLPNDIHFVHELPLGRTGKADRAKVKSVVHKE